jgi:hypothetical protein
MHWKQFLRPPPRGHILGAYTLIYKLSLQILYIHWISKTATNVLIGSLFTEPTRTTGYKSDDDEDDEDDEDDRMY